MRQRIAQFMAGRNGNDQFNRFLLVAELVLLLLSTFIGGGAGRVLNFVVIAVLAYIYFRMFSRNVYKRQDENGKYLRLKYKLTGKLRMWKERWVQRKDYKFFNCPSCKAVMRIPRGRGKVKIVCRKCGNSFIGKS